MDLQPHSPAAALHATSTTRLEPMLIRLPPSLAVRLRQLARSTRIRQSDYLREAVADLLAKYAHLTHEEARP
ncbi:MAG TPA: ribbon-helix-helix domain-containing protein [Anaeromyxobacteraceae bacterium]|nr:ribbon-helix-helix domain-containing protein [Anaeromyxobacteraceae bacterium]